MKENSFGGCFAWKLNASVKSKISRCRILCHGCVGYFSSMSEVVAMMSDCDRKKRFTFYTRWCCHDHFPVWHTANDVSACSVSSAENLGQVLSFKPWVHVNKVLYTSPNDSKSVFLISAFSVYSTSLFFFFYELCSCFFCFFCVCVFVCFCNVNCTLQAPAEVKITFKILEFC